MDRKELEAKIIELVAMSYNKDASELSVDTKIKEELGGSIPFDGRTCFRDRKRTGRSDPASGSGGMRNDRRTGGQS